MTTFKQICDDYEEKTGHTSKLPQINSRLLSQIPTHFDKNKNIKVKIFPTTAGFVQNKKTYTAEIMEGENKGLWTTCFEENLEKI